LKKSTIAPERLNVLKSSDLFFTASEQEEFHQGGEGGYVLLLLCLIGIEELAALLIIFVKVE